MFSPSLTRGVSAHALLLAAAFGALSAVEPATAQSSSSNSLPQVVVTPPSATPHRHIARKVVRRTVQAARPVEARGPAPRATVRASTPAAPLSPRTPAGVAAVHAAIAETEISGGELAARGAFTSDSAGLFADTPGVSLYTAGGVSSLPAVHGLADDRLRIKVDGADIIASCPNHMNPALSYIDPSQVEMAKVWAGVTPVSVGGDSIGGTVVVESRRPVFAAPAQPVLIKGNVGAFYRSNGHVLGANAGATVATKNFSLSYAGAYAKSDNYDAGGMFRHFALISAIAPMPGSREVGSTAYRTINNQFGFAWTNEDHLLDFKISQQFVPKQLYPNQRMDMLKNTAYNFNLRYFGKFSWGDLEARAYHQTVNHYMDFGADKLLWYGNLTGSNGLIYPVLGMPMYTKSKTTGASIKAGVNLSARDLLRIGLDAQAYRLDDWWPPAPNCGVGICAGGMAPLTFWNMNNGRRDRLAGFAEWEAKWNAQWLTLIGARVERVAMNTGPVVGYNTASTPLMMIMMKNMYETSSVGGRDLFNLMNRGRTNTNADLTAMVRHAPNANMTLELGLAQKMRSPNLYERYTWSRAVMAMEMNNFVGDGNGYLGTPDLKPELAHTASFTLGWRSDDGQIELKATPYYTHVHNYIDAVQWNRTTNLPAFAVPWQFVTMKYVNAEARLYGFDLSGKAPIAKTDIGQFGVRGLVNLTKGKNLSTNDGLYNIIPINAKLMLTHKLGGWDSGIELVMSGAKNDVSRARNELQLPGYALVNLRTNYAWGGWRFSAGVENLFNKLYYLPLGGAYVGEGATMSFNKEAGLVGPSGGGVSGTASMWGTGVPGPSRSFSFGANYSF